MNCLEFVPVVFFVVFAIAFVTSFLTSGSLLAWLILALLVLIAVKFIYGWAFGAFNAPFALETMLNRIWWVVFIVMFLVTGYNAVLFAMNLNHLIITGQCPRLNFALKCY